MDRRKRRSDKREDKPNVEDEKKKAHREPIYAKNSEEKRPVNI